MKLISYTTSVGYQILYCWTESVAENLHFGYWGTFPNLFKLMNVLSKSHCIFQIYDKFLKHARLSSVFTKNVWILRQHLFENWQSNMLKRKFKILILYRHSKYIFYLIWEKYKKAWHKLVAVTAYQFNTLACQQGYSNLY